MANEEQLEILKQGVEAWNKWRKANPEINIDLSDANLSWADISKADLSNANLSNANLTRAHFDWADLIRANLRGAYLRGAYFKEANLRKANLHGAYLRGAYFRVADLTRADLSKADLSNANLTRADLSKADLSNANLSKADLSEAILIDTILINATIRETSFVTADLSGADISGANMKDVNTSRWIIKRIKCTHIFKDGKRIDFSEGEFEKAYTQIESLVEMIIDAPFSDLTYYIGRIIEEETNRKHGVASLLFKTQTSLSNNTTKYEFISFSENEKLDEIKKKLSDIQNGLKPVIEEAKAKSESKNIIGIKDEIDLPVPGLVLRPKEINRVLIERWNTISPTLQKIIHTIKSVLQ